MQIQKLYLQLNCYQSIPVYCHNTVTEIVKF